MTDQPVHAEPRSENIELVSTIPLIDWRLHGAIVHVFIVSQFITMYVFGGNAFFWVLSAASAFYGLLLLHFAVMSPRLVRFNTSRQILGVYWRGEWIEFPIAEATTQMGLRTNDTCGWFAKKSACLIISVSSGLVDRGLSKMFSIPHSYRFAVGETDHEIRKWTRQFADR